VLGPTTQNQHNDSLSETMINRSYNVIMITVDMARNMNDYYNDRICIDTICIDIDLLYNYIQYNII